MYIHPKPEIRGLAFVEVTSEDFDGCASWIISCSKYACSKPVFEASILGTTCDPRSTHQNLQ